MAAPLPTADSHAALPTFAVAKCWHCRSCRSKPAVSYANPLAVIMKKYFVIIFITAQLISCNRKANQNNPIQKSAILDTIMISENMDYPKIYALRFVANDWNIETEILYNDYSTENSYSTYLEKIRTENLNKAELKNKPIWKKFDSLRKSDSKQEFRDALNEEMQRIYLGQKIIDSNTTVQKFLRKVYKTDDFVIPVVYSKTNDSEYTWRMWRDLPFDTNKEYDENYGVFADFVIDLKTDAVEIIKYEE